MTLYTVVKKFVSKGKISKAFDLHHPMLQRVAFFLFSSVHVLFMMSSFSLGPGLALTRAGLIFQFSSHILVPPTQSLDMYYCYTVVITW